jgi:two-component system, chemotaxis family, chemotaxis protein CheY
MSKTIMTVDDSISMRQLIILTLQKAGYSLVEASDGKDALEKLSGPPIQMLITDLNMPNMDGVELIRHVRTMPQYKFLPIIVLTTESNDVKKQAARTAGASGWIVKPFQEEQLINVTKKFLG